MYIYLCISVHGQYTSYKRLIVNPLLYKIVQFRNTGNSEATVIILTSVSEKFPHLCNTYICSDQFNNLWSIEFIIFLFEAFICVLIELFIFDFSRFLFLT